MWIIERTCNIPAKIACLARDLHNNLIVTAIEIFYIDN
uniref:Uncharacterized protein n=1 Tax=viral metagenome TaxID=1070528 RepID=A0A6C0CAB2_9ZZZZ